MGNTVANWFSETGRDLQYTFRTLRREVGFTTFAVLIVGLGIGASSVIFSVINALLIQPLPFDRPGELVWIQNRAGDGNLSGQTLQVGNVVDLKEQNRSFSDIAGYFAFYGVGDSKVTGDGEPVRLSEVPVSQNFFPLLGVKPIIGRLFTDEESRFNVPKAVLLGYDLWQRRFNADPAIVGRKLIVNERPATVIGVLPASFNFSSVFAPGSRIDLYSPFPLSQETNRWGNTMSIIGRLKPGVSMAAAQAEFDVLGPRISNLHPERNSVTPQLKMLEQQVSGRLKPALFLLACAVGVVMLIVCANVSNLQLARTATRQKEMAIRTALGAGRARLIRQMLTENIFLSCCGAFLGLAIAYGGTRLLTKLEGFSIPLLSRVSIDSTALLFTLSAAVFTGILFGLMPALQVRGFALHDALKDANRGSTTGKGHAWVRSTLVVAEIAFACVLLVGAGLLLRSFLRVLDVNLGFHPEYAGTMRVDPSRDRCSSQEQCNAYFDEVLRIVRSQPGIEAAGLTDVLPLGRNRTWGFGIKGRVFNRTNFPLAFVRIVSDGYVKALGIPLRAGRDFTPGDDAKSKPVIIINETLAKTYWPNENPIGKLMQMRPEREVIGVVGDVRHINLEQSSGSEMYLPMRQTRDYPSIDLVIRTNVPPVLLAPAIRFALKPIEPNLPGNEFRPLQQLVDKSVSPRRFIMLFLTGFATFALLLASLGIYAVISYSVTQRTQEIGVRAALGASAQDLQMGILKQTMGLAAIGMALGAIASFILARSLSGLLYGVTPADPLTFAAMLVVLTLVAALAGYLPGRRAARIDPMVALRSN